jgi:hypothetical protein
MKITRKILEVGNLLAFFAIIIGLVAAVVLSLERGGMIKLGNCPTATTPCLIIENIFYILLWSVAIGVIALVLVITSEWTISKILYIIPKVHLGVIHFFRNPSFRNLKICSGSLYDNLDSSYKCNR